MPFASLGTSELKLDWWTAYNNVKHSDIHKFHEGNFRNCIYALSGLAIIYTLIDSEFRNGNRIRLFSEIGYVEPERTLQSLLFFK